MKFEPRVGEIWCWSLADGPDPVNFRITSIDEHGNVRGAALIPFGSTNVRLIDSDLYYATYMRLGSWELVEDDFTVWVKKTRKEHEAAREL